MPARVLPGLLAAALLGAGLLATGCRDTQAEHRSTAVLGGSRSQVPRELAPPPLTDAEGRPIPPPAEAGTADLQMVRSGEGGALAVWTQDGHVLAAGWSRGRGWSAGQALERIYGESSAPRLASNGQGVAMAVWHHTVGNIHSLRFSRYDAATGWSPPDVLPGALPRPPLAGAPVGQDAPQLRMDAAGNVQAQWPSGFHANEMQTARYSAGEGWSLAGNEPVAAAPAPAASSAGR
jgi:hypothetical protein